MTLTKATDEEIRAFIDQQGCWTIQNSKLHREYLFNDFIQAFGFMTEVAVVAERTDHHPEWFNVYKKVVVDLTTHEVGGISSRDFKLARSMDEIAGRAE